MSGRHGLNQQISSLDVLIGGLAMPAIKEVEFYDKMVKFHLGVLHEMRATLVFMQTHEQTIRDAIRAQRELDAVAERE